MKKLFCSQPKLLICIELKLAEILGVCGIIGILYLIGYSVVGLKFFSHMNLWYEMIITGLLCLVALFMLFSLCVGIYQVIKANWAWAERISKNRFGLSERTTSS